jgi:adenine-specific DNA-methyltransferase
LYEIEIHFGKNDAVPTSEFLLKKFNYLGNTVFFNSVKNPNQILSDYYNSDTKIARYIRRWAYIPESMVKVFENGRVFLKEGNLPRYKKFQTEYDGKALKSIYYTEFSTQQGTEELAAILQNSAFEYPKSTKLIQMLIKAPANHSATILDFFAGSGTTLHATMQLNAEDGGNRQCILVTNNENKIAEEVCYERNKRVIQGYTNSKGEAVPGLTNNNLRYYKCGFVPNQNTPKNRRQLVLQSTDLLCIKENCYTEVSIQPTASLPATRPDGVPKSGEDAIRVFEGKEKFLMVIYDELAVEHAIAVIKTLPKPVSVYTFSPDADPYTDEFEEVSDKVTLCALPDAILQAYRRVAPKKRSKLRIEAPELPNEAEVSVQRPTSAGESLDLFNTLPAEEGDEA